jgi:hypothetical protein
MAELNENTFWISGIINGDYRECDGPYTTTKDISNEGYPYVTQAPNPKYTHQKYDYIAHAWVDTSDEALLHTVEDVQNAVSELKSNSAQDVKKLQSDQEAGTTQNLALTNAVKQLSEGQVDQNKLLASMQSLLLAIVSSQKTAEPTAPTQSTQATTAPATDK